jgi:hypothetical protein
MMRLLQSWLRAAVSHGPRPLQIGKTPCDEADPGLKAGLSKETICLISSLNDTGSHEPTFIAQSAKHPKFWVECGLLFFALCPPVRAVNQKP